MRSVPNRALETALTAAEAEMNDDSVLREQLLEAEMRREMGEISDEEFADIEADLLARIREIRERREGGSGPLEMSAAQPLETTGDARFQVEASVSGDFYNPADAPHTTIVESSPASGEQVTVLDMERSNGSNRSNRSKRSNRSERSKRSAAEPETTGTTGTPRTPRTTGTDRTPRTLRTSRTSRTIK